MVIYVLSLYAIKIIFSSFFKVQYPYDGGRAILWNAAVLDNLLGYYVFLYIYPPVLGGVELLKMRPCLGM